jgi:cell wall-associated NlpC family hydrolase
VTKRAEAARHRAAASSGTFEQLSKAVTANAGTVSRQAAVVAAAGGLVVTLGVSGSTSASKVEAAPKADSNTTSLDLQRVAKTEIHAPAVKSAPKGGSLVKVVAKPAQPERELARATVTQPVQQERTLPRLERTADTTPATTTRQGSSTESSSNASNDNESTASSSSSSSSESTKSTKSAETTAAPAANGSGIVSTAKSYTGSPYVRGGVTPSGWDCLGFVSYVFKQNGINIDNSYGSVLAAGKKVPYSQVQAGDILYWPGHVAISLGGDQNIGAWQPGMGTRVGPNSWVGGTPTVIRVG